jgi:hypothetical protein
MFPVSLGGEHGESQSHSYSWWIMAGACENSCMV